MEKVQKCEVQEQSKFHVPVALTHGKEALCQVDRRLGGPRAPKVKHSPLPHF
jgi:hypothetical protein